MLTLSRICTDALITPLCFYSIALISSNVNIFAGKIFLCYNFLLVYDISDLFMKKKGRKMNCKAAVFDLDGTLLDTLEDLYLSVNRALAHFSLPERTKGEVQAFVGNGVEMLMVQAVPSGRENPLFLPCLQYFKEDYALHSLDHTAPYPGIVSLLSKLNTRGIQCAVVSNKFDAAVKELVNHFFDGLVLCARGESLGIRRKPAPDTVLAVLDELHVQKKDAVYIGDSEVDILTAKNCDMPCISVLWGFRKKEFLQKKGAAVFAETPQELLKHLVFF